MSSCSLKAINVYRLGHGAINIIAIKARTHKESCFSEESGENRTVI